MQDAAHSAVEAGYSGRARLEAVLRDRLATPMPNLIAPPAA